MISTQVWWLFNIHKDRPWAYSRRAWTGEHLFYRCPLLLYSAPPDHRLTLWLFDGEIIMKTPKVMKAQRHYSTSDLALPIAFIKFFSIYKMMNNSNSVSEDTALCLFPYSIRNLNHPYSMKRSASKWRWQRHKRACFNRNVILSATLSPYTRCKTSLPLY